MQTGRRPRGSHKPACWVRLPGLQLRSSPASRAAPRLISVATGFDSWAGDCDRQRGRVPQLVEGSGREPDCCGFDSHPGHSSEDREQEAGDNGARGRGGLGVCLANRRSGFDSRPFHQAGMWSNGKTPSWHGGDPGSIPGKSTRRRRRGRQAALPPRLEGERARSPRPVGSTPTPSADGDTRNGWQAAMPLRLLTGGPTLLGLWVRLPPLPLLGRTDSEAIRPDQELVSKASGG